MQTNAIDRPTLVTDLSIEPDLGTVTSDPVSVCDAGRRKWKEIAGLGGGAIFVLVPNSELVHAVLRAALGVGGYECC